MEKKKSYYNNGELLYLISELKIDKNNNISSTENYEKKLNELVTIIKRQVKRGQNKNLFKNLKSLKDIPGEVLLAAEDIVDWKMLSYCELPHDTIKKVFHKLFKVHMFNHNEDFFNETEFLKENLTTKDINYICSECNNIPKKFILEFVDDINFIVLFRNKSVPFSIIKEFSDKADINIWFDRHKSYFTYGTSLTPEKCLSINDINDIVDFINNGKLDIVSFLCSGFCSSDVLKYIYTHMLLEFNDVLKIEIASVGRYNDFLYYMVDFEKTYKNNENSWLYTRYCWETGKRYRFRNKAIELWKNVDHRVIEVTYTPFNSTKVTKRELLTCHKDFSTKFLIDNYQDQIKNNDMCSLLCEQENLPLGLIKDINKFMTDNKRSSAYKNVLRVHNNFILKCPELIEDFLDIMNYKKKDFKLFIENRICGDYTVTKNIHIHELTFLYKYPSDSKEEVYNFIDQILYNYYFDYDVNNNEDNKFLKDFIIKYVECLGITPNFITRFSYKNNLSKAFDKDFVWYIIENSRNFFKSEYYINTNLENEEVESDFDLGIRIIKTMTDDYYIRSTISSMLQCFSNITIDMYNKLEEAIASLKEYTDRDRALPYLYYETILRDNENASELINVIIDSEPSEEIKNKIIEYGIEENII